MIFKATKDCWVIISADYGCGVFQDYTYSNMKDAQKKCKELGEGYRVQRINANEYYEYDEYDGFETIRPFDLEKDIMILEVKD